MREIRVRNVNYALPIGLNLLLLEGIRRPSRNGPVLEYPEAVATVYERPLERVLFSPERDANHYFHFFECLHMIAGRNDVAWLAQFNKKVVEYSDDGQVFHGAYGHRWRSLGMNQLEQIVELLRSDPGTRRAVLQMWNCSCDLGKDSKDLPCNTHAYFKIREGRLHMTVCCRSNDIIWGAYGANAVHFSFLLEYVAAMVGVPVGVYTQISDSFHMYEEVYEKLSGLSSLSVSPAHCLYTVGEVEPFPITPLNGFWNYGLKKLFKSPETFSGHRFFDEVVRPLYLSFIAYKSKDFTNALCWAKHCAAKDWGRAATEWLKRRPSYLDT